MDGLLVQRRRWAILGIGSSKSAFMSGRHVASLFAGLAALLGALVALAFPPSRREFGEAHAHPGVAPRAGAVAVH
jgi:hypothetical protein